MDYISFLFLHWSQIIAWIIVYNTRNRHYGTKVVKIFTYVYALTKNPVWSKWSVPDHSHSLLEMGNFQQLLGCFIFSWISIFTNRSGDHSIDQILMHNRRQFVFSILFQILPAENHSSQAILFPFSSMSADELLHYNSVQDFHSPNTAGPPLYKCISHWSHQNKIARDIGRYSISSSRPIHKSIEKVIDFFNLLVIRCSA